MNLRQVSGWFRSYSTLITRSSKVLVNSLTAKLSILICSILLRACSSSVESWKRSKNLVRELIHMSGTLSACGSRLSSQSLICLAHNATFSPLMRVRVKATFLIGELNPATSALTWRYALTSSMKAFALVRSPEKYWGSPPMALVSGFIGMGWSALGGMGMLGCPGPGGSPGLPPPGGLLDGPLGSLGSGLPSAL